MRNIAMTALLLAACVMAADVSGKWSGSFTSGGQGPQPMYLILKQDGNQLSGSGGPSVSEQHPLQNGSVQGDRLTFELPGQGNVYLRFENDRL